MFGYRTFVLFGDSITQRGSDPFNDGWVSGLQHTYIRRADVINRGFSGYNTEWALNVLAMILPNARASAPTMGNASDEFTEQSSPSSMMIGRPASIELLIICLGANDAAIPPSGQHVPLTRYRENLKMLVDLVQSPMSRYYSPKTRVMLVSPPPLDEAKWAKQCNSDGKMLDRKATTTQKYAETCVKLANELNVPVLDLHTMLLEKAGGKPAPPRSRVSALFSAFSKNNSRHKEHGSPSSSDDGSSHAKSAAEGSSGTLGDYLIDGLHLGPLGNRVLFEGVVGVIKRAWPDLDPATLPELLPNYSSLAANKTDAVRMLHAHASGEEISALAKGKQRAEEDEFEAEPSL